MAIRDAMWTAAGDYVRPDERLQVVFGAQTASQYLAALTGFVAFYAFNRYRIVAVTSDRILVLDAGRTSLKKARGVVTELPRFTELGPGKGAWHRIPAGSENLRVHRRFFKDIESADRALRFA